jgi:hypothetical protein
MPVTILGNAPVAATERSPAPVASGQPLTAHAERHRRATDDTIGGSTETVVSQPPKRPGTIERVANLRCDLDHLQHHG